LTGQNAPTVPAPVFFLSYGRTGSRRDTDPVASFFDDLSAQMSQLVDLLPGREPGFMDRTMDGGQDWERHILGAAGTSQVFVALLSTRYVLRSVWCAREWDLASRRLVKPRPGFSGGTETMILPVLWAPIKVPIPDRIKRIQLFSPTDLHNPAYRQRYETNGIYGLWFQDPDAYKSIVWQLAMRIQTMWAAQYVEPWIPESTAGLAENFGEVTP
jgi:TIR domain-containing protein